MKKSLKIILPIVGCLLILLSIVLIRSCANNEYRNLDITFGKKYYNIESVNSSANAGYYVFRANGTGECGSDGADAKIFFKYTVMDNNKIICFYHYSEGYTTTPPTDWYREFVVSKNVIKYTESSNLYNNYNEEDYYYVCENYIPKIPNFKG